MPVSGFSIARRWSFYHDTMLLFSRSVMSDSLWPHGLQHARFPCPSPSTGACSNSRPFSQWCHPTISPSVVPFSSCLQSFPASGSFQMSQLFTSGGQSIEVSNSTSVLPMNIQDWFPLGWTGWISSSLVMPSIFPNIRVFSNESVFRIRWPKYNIAQFKTWISCLF